MLERLHSTPGMARDEILKNIVGYSTLIQTPFGAKCALYADHTATGRPFRMIEDLVTQKIKPMIANSHTETSLMGYFSTQLLHYAENSILRSFKVSKATHFSVPTGNGATGAFERLTKILRVSEIAKREEILNPGLNKSANPNIPQVYISPYEHHSNILPWQNAGCHLQKVNGDKYGNMDLKNLEDLLKKNSHFKVQIISVSATSNVTSQRTDLKKVNSIVKEYKKNHLKEGQQLFFIVDGAAFCSHNRLDLSDDGFSEIEFVCISPHKHLGGSESTGVLIAKLSAYDSSLPPSFPGGGTVKAVVGLESEQTWYDNDPTSREMPGTPNAIGFYRAALTFELQDHIGLDYILEKEEQNAKYFFNRIQQLNEEFSSSGQIPPRRIHIYGDPDIERRYDVFSFNVYGPGTNTDSEGKSVFHPNFVARVLNDVFGVQVRSGCSCAGPYGVLLLGIPEKNAHEIVNEMLQGYEQVKPGWVRLDTFFSFEKYELDYIINAIRLIALYGQKLMRYYEVSSKTAQFQLKGQSHPSFDFSLFGLQTENILEIPLEQREKYFSDQMEIGKKMLESPDSYIKENFPHISADSNSDHSGQNSHSQFPLNLSHSSGLSDKSAKATRTLKAVSSPVHKPQVVAAAAAYPQTKEEKGMDMKQIISSQIRDQLRDLFQEHPYSKFEGTDGGNSSQSVVMEIFRKYTNPVAGVHGMNQMSVLSFAQDYNLLSGKEISINEIISLFNQISSDTNSSGFNESQINQHQFYAFIENLALRFYQNSKQYMTISEKIKAFTENILSEKQKKFPLTARAAPTQPQAQINWNEPLNSSRLVVKRPYLVSKTEQSPTLNNQDMQAQFFDNRNGNNLYGNLDSSRSAKKLNGIKLNDSVESSNIFKAPQRNLNNYSQVSASQNVLTSPPAKNYYYQDSFPVSTPSNLQKGISSSQVYSKKELMMKRAAEISKQQANHEKNLYQFVSK